MSKNENSNTAEIRITNQIIEFLKKGVAPWQKGWNLRGGVKPFNFQSGRAYTGYFNPLMLAMAAEGKLPAFAPFTKEFPAMKGAKSTAIFKPYIVSFEDEKTGEKKNLVRGFSLMSVFHYTQLQNVDFEAVEKKFARVEENPLDFKPIEVCEQVIANRQNPAPIFNDGGNQAYYVPAKDSIHMPLKESFKTEEDYYATLFHEVGHSTGHFTRLNRKDGMENIRFGSHSYSFEELVAELTSCFVQNECGIVQTQIENSAAYIQHWIEKLQKNTDWIFQASTLASKASNYILNKNMKEVQEPQAA